jgi:hypothetical protein
LIGPADDDQLPFIYGLLVSVFAIYMSACPWEMCE